MEIVTLKKLKQISLARISLAREIHELEAKDLTEEKYKELYDELSKKHKAILKELSDEIKKLKEDIQKYENFFEIIDIWTRDQPDMEWHYIKEKVKEGKGPQDIKDFVNSFITMEEKEEEYLRRRILDLIK